MGKLRGRVTTRHGVISIDFVIPGSLDTRTGGFRYDKRVTEELRALGHRVSVHEIDDSFPFPTSAAKQQAESVLASIKDDSLTVIDGLAFSVLPDILAQHANRLRLLALIHHPLALETGLSEDAAKTLQTSETQALTYARHVITTSVSTTASLAEYQVPSDRITTVEPGTDQAHVAHGKSGAGLSLLCVATITERKGHRVLVDALARVLEDEPELEWHCHLVGSSDRDPPTRDALYQQISATGLEGRISLHGEADDDALDLHYAAADLFVLPSFHEGYGMVLTEAIARGLPIVSTTAGAIPDTVPQGSGQLVPPGDAEALAASLHKLLTEPAALKTLREGARRARSNLRSWSDVGAEFAQACGMT